MKKLYLIGNLKMNMTRDEIVPYLDEYIKVANGADNVTGICVPYVYLCKTAKIIKGSKALWGVQNMNSEEKGAYTGEISPKMLQDFDTKLVIIGHSERRQMYNETDESVNKKVKVALAYGYTPIMCFGETLDEREGGKHFDKVRKQIELGIDGVTKEDVTKMIFAYEPIWAIGTGKTATSAEAEEIIKYAKDIIANKYGLEHKDIIMLYGGSLKPSNAKEILSQPDIDGGLIGGACLKMEDFKSIIYTNVE